MASKRMNVLVYSGNGATIDSVRHCLYTLRRLLSPKYAVLTVAGDAIIKEPWTASCAMLVLPGGADLGYCRTLNGEGNRRILQFVERGGAYLGFCAGGYYGSKRCEFEVGNKNLEVAGNRELAFYPDTCRGCAFPGYVPHSEAGARNVELKVSKNALGASLVPEIFRSYYNGGGVFVDASRYHDEGVEILASFTENTHVDAGEDSAAVVYCKVGDGAAILTSPHPEFASVNLAGDEDSEAPGYSEIVEALSQYDKPRTDFLKACLMKLGLRVNQDEDPVPSLSRLHLSSLIASTTTELVASLEDIITVENDEEYINDDNDTFHIERPSSWSVPEKQIEKANEQNSNEDRILNYSTIIKRVVVHDKEYPASKETPYFDHHAYFTSLKHYQSQSRDEQSGFGQQILYGEVVTSTSTILEKNTQILRRLPSGLTATATVQVAGRGRGNNVWVSPAGALVFSTVIRHPVSLLKHAPVIFLQYLAALAVVEGIKNYDDGYQNLPIKLKWPNDICKSNLILSLAQAQGSVCVLIRDGLDALDPDDPTGKIYVKIGGILVNSHYSSSEYHSVVGIGINTANANPSISLNALRPPVPFTLEKLLARILTCFSGFYTRFKRTGFDRHFEEMYYRHWLHTDQIVTLEAEGGVRARIKGITTDWGLLVAEELGWEDRPTGKRWTLQTDSNSFDFFKGLVKKKV
ncbi:biotin holocarboxylase synthetase [Pseudocyphellaria aurata]|nr:biotin holocarboxylase synthetase [Pseudocyphellaria aurata]